MAPAAPRRSRSGGSSASCLRARASASLSPAGTIKPFSSSRTRPPAAAPTASLAITARPRFMASLITRPHGSRNARVLIDGSTSTSAAAYTLRSSSGATGSRPNAPAGAPAAWDSEPTPISASAAAGSVSLDLRHASSSTSTPFSRWGRPTNTNFVLAAAGHRGSLGGFTSGERQKSLSTACGATCTLCAPRALTYALTCGPYVTTASAERYNADSGR